MFNRFTGILRRIARGLRRRAPAPPPPVQPPLDHPPASKTTIDPWATVEVPPPNPLPPPADPYSTLKPATERQQTCVAGAESSDPRT
jgi:hypothetical protein